MSWLLLVFVVSSIGEAPEVVFQTTVATQELCQAAASEITRALEGSDAAGNSNVKPVCIQVSS